jgi:hypothetical protein
MQIDWRTPGRGFPNGLQGGVLDIACMNLHSHKSSGVVLRTLFPITVLPPKLNLCLKGDVGQT